MYMYVYHEHVLQSDVSMCMKNLTNQSKQASQKIYAIIISFYKFMQYKFIRLVLEQTHTHKNVALRHIHCTWMLVYINRLYFHRSCLSRSVSVTRGKQSLERGGVPPPRTAWGSSVNSGPRTTSSRRDLRRQRRTRLEWTMKTGMSTGTLWVRKEKVHVCLMTGFSP